MIVLILSHRGVFTAVCYCNTSTKCGPWDSSLSSEQEPHQEYAAPEWDRYRSENWKLKNCFAQHTLVVVSLSTLFSPLWIFWCSTATVSPRSLLWSHIQRLMNVTPSWLTGDTQCQIMSEQLTCLWLPSSQVQWWGHSLTAALTTVCYSEISDHRMF